MRYIILALCLFVTLQKQLNLNYNHKLKIIQVYDAEDQIINLQLTF